MQILKTFQITFFGIVQGVGFRPTVLKVATDENAFVKISNTSKGVVLISNAIDEKKITFFIEKIIKVLPDKAKIYTYEIKEIEYQNILQNEVYYEENNLSNSSFITPDYAWCLECKKEYLDVKNKRYNFKFIGCTQCGPRFSLINSLPFERENTQMNEFLMCESCKNEYENINSRRYFSQLNSCQKCNFSSTLIGYNQKDTNLQIEHISKLIKEDKIIAVKGIAGFLFICNPYNINIIKELRKRKKRPRKPFAIMLKDIEFVEEHFFVSPKEKKTLLSDAFPIVLLYPKLNSIFYDLKEITSNNLLGIMLAPSAYLFELCKNNNSAILATSANISGHPLVYENETAEKELTQIADNIWHYERKINFPQDDSVICFSPIFNQKIFLRKARGFSPSLFDLPKYDLPKNVLGLGAEMKSTFTLNLEQQVYISSYLGILNNQENLDHFVINLEKFIEVTKIKNKYVAIDWHPLFYYNNLIENFKKNDRIIFKVQHHFAHAVAIMAEKNLIKNKNVACFIFDGLGLGKNNEIWGGEVFIFDENKIIHISCFPFFKYLLGDRMSNEPRISFFSIMGGKIPEEFMHFYSKFEINNWEKVLYNQVITNSLGRFFDALAFILGFPFEKQSFEGECGQWLEKQINKDFNLDYFNQNNVYFNNFPSSWDYIFHKIISDKKQNISNEIIIVNILKSISLSVCNFALKNDIYDIAFSGGCLQNRFLVDCLIYESKKNGLNCHFHENLSPNDENISYGQVMAVNFFSDSEWVIKDNI